MSETLTPEAPTGLPPENNDMRHEKKSAYTPRQKLIAVLSGVAVALGVGVGIGTANSGERAPEATSSSAPANPGETTAPTETAVPAPEVLTVKSQEIPAGLSPEELGKTLVEGRWNAWIMAGANQATNDEAINSPLDTTDFALKKAAENSAIFAEALYAPGFQSDEHLSKVVADQEHNNTSTLESWLITSDDEHPFSYNFVVDSTELISQTDTSVTISIFTTEFNNGSENRIGTQYQPEVLALNGVKAKTEVTFTQIDGSMKISALQAQAAN